MFSSLGTWLCLAGYRDQESLLQAASFVETIQNWQDIVIPVLEEIGFINGFIVQVKLFESVKAYDKRPYSVHLEVVAEGKVGY